MKHTHLGTAIKHLRGKESRNSFCSTLKLAPKYLYEIENNQTSITEETLNQLITKINPSEQTKEELLSLFYLQPNQLKLENTHLLPREHRELISLLKEKIPHLTTVSIENLKVILLKEL